MTTSRILCIAMLGLLAVSAAHAQPAETGASTREAPETSPEEGSPTDDRMGTGAAYERSGGSLVRAGRGPQASSGEPSAGDPRVAGMGFFGVSPPPRRVIQPHDLITIVIKEQSEFKSEGTSKLDKKASLEAAINEFITLNLNNAQLEPLVGATKPKIDVEGSMKFDGKGSAERKDSLSVRLQAEVIDVKPNGNLVLAARRRIKTEDEERVFLVSGVVRVQDVTTDNTVLSTQMFDFDLTQETKGTVRNATRRGWLPRLLDAINPF
jgi:flagellar L-ring protein FlgH